MTWLWVAIAGGLGSALRYGVGLGCERFHDRWPVGTMTVNVLGSMLIGFVFAWAEDRTVLSVEIRTVLGTGLMGGFTTYSAFNQETFVCLTEGQYGRAALYVASTLVACLLCGWAGHAIGTAIR